MPTRLRALLGLTFAALGVGCSSTSPAPATNGAAAPDSPRLVVMVVVDQLRADLLEVYAPALRGGFARLRRDGLVFTQASHLHASTSTAVGHTTLATGVTPARHGVVGNDFWHRPDGNEMVSTYSMADEAAPVVGIPEMSGRSPRNLLRTGLADWMSAADPGTRVLSVSRKDRGAIPLAGKVRGHVYWIAAGQGRFVTSTYYRSQNPGWVSRFNRDRMPEILGDAVWARVTPDSLTPLARRDSVEYEGDGVHVVFPHRREAESSGSLPRAQVVWAEETPAPDRAVLDFALTGLRELELGKRRGGTDLLAISFSQTDNVGHAYGPMSQEQLSNLVHLDGLMGELIEALDREVGAGRWILGLSADHGVMTAPEWLAEKGEPGRRLDRDERRELNRLASEAAAAAGSMDAIPAAVKAAVETLPSVVRAFTGRDFGGEPADTIIALFANSHRDDRSWGTLGRYGVYVQFRADVLNRTSSRGTSHGSPYWHDRHVPLILYGDGVAPGVRREPVHTFDMAPTLAALSGIPIPSDLDGRPLITGSGGSP